MTTHSEGLRFCDYDSSLRFCDCPRNPQNRGNIGTGPTGRRKNAPRRASVLVLIAIAMTGYGLPHGWTAAPGPPANGVTMVGMSRAAKGVAIPSGPVYKKEFFELLQLPQFGLRQITVINRLNEAVLPGAERDLTAGATHVRNPEVEVRGLLERHKSNSTDAPNLIGGSLTGIQNNWPKFEFVSLNHSLPKLLPYDTDYVSPQSGFARLCACLLFARGPRERAKSWQSIFR